MRPTVRAIFRRYSEKLEGRTRHPYCDKRDLVTVSIGCKIDPIDLAIDLPWMIGDRPATHAEIRDDWQSLKERSNEVSNWVASKQAPLTSIRLTDEGVDGLLTRRLQANYDYLRTNLMPGLGEFSADAQLGILSLAWAVGADFRATKPPRPAFISACNAQDWLAAKFHARLREIDNAGVVDRNRQHEILFDNALTVQERGLPPDWLWWPNVTPRGETLRESAIRAVGLIDDPVGTSRVT